jgi:hypothetical protein
MIDALPADVREPFCNDLAEFLDGLVSHYVHCTDGLVFMGVDLAAGMPWWWTAFEGPPAAPFGALVYFVARPVR